MNSRAKQYNSLAYSTVQEMSFGIAREPVTTSLGVKIGGGAVLPEVNFTLPTMSINDSTIDEICSIYALIVEKILERAVDLHQESLVLEFEQLYEMTLKPDWGARITADMRQVMERFHKQHGLKSALRVTIADIREKDSPPLMRSGEPIKTMLAAFDLCAGAGADILAIESTGGKEITDRALLEGDIDGLIYGMGVLAQRDMAYLWDRIVEIAEKHGVIPGGDTACGFANTAMQLAHTRMLPKVLAATMRLMCAPRSLVAVERGARGPLKDCGYENPIIKAITGVPIAMEGKTSACAHFSPLGNIAASVCDLWSNESVQDVRLLSGSAPEVFAEILIYDCRLMNVALNSGRAELLQEMFKESDYQLDIQALVMDMDVMFETARRIVEAGPDGYARTVAAAQAALEALSAAKAEGRVPFSRSETRWLGKIEKAIQGLPDDPAELRERLNPEYTALFLPVEYGMA